MDSETRSDVQKVTFAGLTALTIIVLFVALRVIVPGLINMHNDGALILAILITLGSLGGAFLVFRLLYRTYKFTKGDHQS